MRVVSLLPSATETLCLILGSGGEGSSAPSARAGGVELVGRSHECDWPPSVLEKPVLTRATADLHGLDAAGVDKAVRDFSARGEPLYAVDEALLRGLRPDLILTQDLCSVCSIDLPAVRRIASGMDPEPRVLSLNPASIEDVLDDVLRVGRAVGLASAAERAMLGLRDRLFRAAEFVTPYVEGPRALVLEWTDPLFVGGHWTPQLVERAGASHALNPTAPMPGAGDGAGGHMAHRMAGASVATTPEAVSALGPEVVIVCPCGVGLARAREEARGLCAQAWFRALPAARTGRVAVVDGNQMFSRPGPRLIDAMEWLVGWLHERPELIPEGFPWEEVRCG